MIENQHIHSDNGRHRQFWWMIAGVWTILALFMGGQLFLRLSGTDTSIPWYDAVLMEAFYCAQWVLLAPVILWLIRHFPFNKKRWLSASIMHLVIAIVVSSLTMGVRAILSWMFIHGMRDPLTLQGIISNMPQAYDFGVMSYMLNLLLGYSFEYSNKLREREVRAAQLETELSRAQLQALKMQLHPHFLFNTLNAIAMLVRKGSHDDAVETISRLSKFLRYTLENIHSQEITLKEETELLDLYLSIQQVRFQDGLTITKNIDSDTRDSRVPTLILQPLVENALRHGIAKREAGGHLTICAKRENGVVYISVQDDGPGLPSSWTLSTHQGIGLQNTISRLEKLYGDSYNLELHTVNGSGVIANLRIPFHDQPIEAEDIRE